MRRVKTKAARSGGWRQWKEDDARRALAELAASGETLLGFSRRTGVSLARFAYWRKRLPVAAAPTSFVAVDLVGVSARQLEIVASTEFVDGRKGIDGLSALVRSRFAEDPLSGTLFVLFTRRADRVRVSAPALLETLYG